MTNTKHFNLDRVARENVIKWEIGYGTPVAEFIVDRGHANGAERHEITDTGIINIYNARTGRLVTKLIARAGQITRYFRYTDTYRKVYDRANIAELKAIANKHEALGYNNI